MKPIKAIAVATLLQLPSEGFAISNTGESTYSEANPIPVGVENPSGLVYRVQIGAFAKPIPQNLYKEFNPVSGEKIEGTNVTRYSLITACLLLRREEIFERWVIRMPLSLHIVTEKKLVLVKLEKEKPTGHAFLKGRMSL